MTADRNSYFLNQPQVLELKAFFNLLDEENSTVDKAKIVQVKHYSTYEMAQAIVKAIQASDVTTLHQGLVVTLDREEPYLALELDYDESAAYCDNLTVVWLSPTQPLPRTWGYEYIRLTDIIDDETMTRLIEYYYNVKD